MPEKILTSTDSMRLDKWLWCARFYKTRQLAVDAIKAGKIKFEGKRVKPARTVHPGEIYSITRTPFTQTVIVRSLATQRRSATEAASLYEETPESLASSNILKEQLKAHNALYPQSRRRPTKRERRKLVRFRQQGE
ncbi:MAG: S4 domain-containing protein [Gammaproteobacteria bacterium]